MRKVFAEVYRRVRQGDERGRGPVLDAAVRAFEDRRTLDTYEPIKVPLWGSVRRPGILFDPWKRRWVQSQPWPVAPLDPARLP